MSGGTNDFKTTDTYFSSPTPYFGYYQALGVSKRVLGGPLIWNKATFTQTFSTPKPHYKFNLKFKVVLGDDFSGDFRYSIAGA
jgi:hypothetical protein